MQYKLTKGASGCSSISSAKVLFLQDSLCLDFYIGKIFVAPREGKSWGKGKNFWKSQFYFTAARNIGVSAIVLNILRRMTPRGNEKVRQNLTHSHTPMLAQTLLLTHTPILTYPWMLVQKCMHSHSRKRHRHREMEGDTCKQRHIYRWGSFICHSPHRLIDSLPYRMKDESDTKANYQAAREERERNARQSHTYTQTHALRQRETDREQQGPS